MVSREVSRYSKRDTEALKASLRALDFEHAEINGQRITDPLFEEYYYEHRTHMLNVMEEFYEAKLLAGILTFEDVRKKLSENVPIDDEDSSLQPTIRLRGYEIEHLVSHLAAWAVRERRMDRYNRRGNRERARSLEDIYDALGPERKAARQAELKLIGDAFPERPADK